MKPAHKTAFFCYEFAWGIALPFLKKNERLADGSAQRVLVEKLPEADVWIQAASVGESMLAGAVLERLRPRRPVRILLTSTTRQGLDILESAVSGLPDSGDIRAEAAFFPFDRPSIMENALSMVSPELLILLETEIWPGLFLAARKKNIQTMIINGRIKEKNLKRYRIWPSLWKALAPGLIMAVSEADAQRFRSLFGLAEVEVMPNIKFDRLGSSSGSLSYDDLSHLLPEDAPFVVFGSTRKAEEPMVEKMIMQLLEKMPEAVIGLFPRHMHRIDHWKRVLKKMGNLRMRSETRSRVSRGSILLWDRFGELSMAYKSASAAFVGGSLAPLGGQNFLEPLFFGLIPVTGPSWWNFAWIGEEIMSSGLVRQARDFHEVVDILVEQIKTPEPREKTRKKAMDYIRARQGGTDLACRRIEENLKNRRIPA